MNNKIRCACGKSKMMPWCDGSHREEQWACDGQLSTKVARAFAGSPALMNLVRRLAWRFNGEIIEPGEQKSGKQLVIIDDGSNLKQLHSTMTELQFEQVFYIGIDFATEMLAASFGFAHHLSVSGTLPEVFISLETVIDLWFKGLLPRTTPNFKCEQLKSAFISHAVADEPVLLPVVESFRQLAHLNLFMCFDSIAKGEKWRSQIEAALHQCQLFIFVISKESIKSTYCAYEIGYAHSMGKPICLVSLDGTRPPPFVAQLNCIDLPRELNARPWLDLDSALTLQLLAFTAKLCPI